MKVYEIGKKYGYLLYQDGDVKKLYILKNKVNLFEYLYRYIFNIGPHGKHCGCDKWKNDEITLRCCNPTWKLDINGELGK